jgi:Predicted periplasmic protein
MIRNLALPLAALAVLLPAVSASAQSTTASLTLSLDSAGDIERNVVTYQCDDEQTLSVQYVNAAPNFLAIVPVDGQNHVFVTTISASGARYVAGPFEWWSSGDEATLRDLMQDEDAGPLANCTAVSNTP